MFKSQKFFLIALIALCLSFGTVNASYGKTLRYAKAPNGEDIICVFRFGMLQNCYPKVFQPTAEYQTILEGQQIPKGLDVQISMRTGERRAKLSEAQIRAQRLAQQYQEYQPQYFRRQYQHPNEYYRQRIQEQQRQYQLQQQLKEQQRQQYLQELQRQRILREKQEQQRLQQEQQYIHYLQQQQLKKQREAQEAKEQYIQYVKRQQKQREVQEIQKQYLEYLQQRKQQEAEEAQRQYLRYLQKQEKLRELRRRFELQSQAEAEIQNQVEGEGQNRGISQEEEERYQQEKEQLIEEVEEVIKEEQLNGQSETNDQPQEQPQGEQPTLNQVVILEKKEEGEEKQPQPQQQNQPQQNETETETEHKVKIHSGKYKSTESPSVESPENTKEGDSDSDSSGSGSDSDDEAPGRIYYQDRVSFEEAFGSLVKAETVEEKLEVLEQIEDIVHHIEFGQLLMKTINDFLPYLKHENSKVRSLSAICIGSSLQNNPGARKMAIKHHLFDILIERLTNEEDVTVLKRLCYAFSNLVRGNVRMIKKIHETKTLELLYKLYVNKPALRSKLETLITDIFDPEKMKEGTKLEEFMDKEGAQLWCTTFQNNILSNEGYIPDTINSLSILLEAGHCSTVQSDLREVLKELPKTQPDLFEDSLDINTNIEKVLNYQGPINPQPTKQRLYEEL